MDGNFGGDVDTRCSTTGLMFCSNVGLILWRSCLQPITTLSTIKAENISIIEAAKVFLWLKELALEMGLAHKTIKVHYDSQIALLFAQNLVYHARMKHINIR